MSESVFFSSVCLVCLVWVLPLVSLCAFRSPVSLCVISLIALSPRCFPLCDIISKSLCYLNPSVSVLGCYFIWSHSVPVPSFLPPVLASSACSVYFMYLTFYFSVLTPACLDSVCGLSFVLSPCSDWFSGFHDLCLAFWIFPPVLLLCQTALWCSYQKIQNYLKIPQKETFSQNFTTPNMSDGVVNRIILK